MARREAPPAPGAPEPRVLQARGQERRAQIVDAAAAYALRHGVAALAHRAVAAEAGVPLGSTTYYFATLGELRAAAVDRLLLGDRARRASVLGEGLAADVPAADLAWRLLDLVLGVGRLDDPPQVALLYERLAEASRSPELASVVRVAAEEVEADCGRLVQGTPWETADPAALVAVVDGRAIGWLAHGGRPAAALVDAVASDLQIHQRTA